jgi:hypothetical protein
VLHAIVEKKGGKKKPKRKNLPTPFLERKTISFLEALLNGFSLIISMINVTSRC